MEYANDIYIYICIYIYIYIYTYVYTHTNHSTYIYIYINGIQWYPMLIWESMVSNLIKRQLSNHDLDGHIDGLYLRNSRGHRGPKVNELDG